MNYTQFFNKLLLEGSEMQPSNTHEVPEGSASSMFDQDFDPEALETDGIQKEISKIQAAFDRKMSILNNIEQLTPDQIDSKLEELEDYIQNLQPYLDAKEVDMTNSYSIMANIIKTDPRKNSAFENTLSAIEDYKETARKNQEMVELASKELQSKVGQLAKARSNQQPESQPQGGLTAGPQV
jgi:hypothetical protein